jgi:uncharacterized membrane protein
MLPSFGYVEGAGLFYGMSLIARTLMPVIYIGLIIRIERLRIYL